MSISLFENQKVIEGKRIKLVPLTPEHASDLFEINHPDIWTYMFTKIEKIEDMENWVNAAIQQREQKTGLPYVVLLKETNQIVGATRLFEVNINQRSCEIGYTWYAKEFQRTFVNSDCKYTLLSYCFNELDCVRVQFTTSERNTPSQTAIERLGAVKEGVRRNGRVLSNGVVEDAIVYSITNEDWPSIKKKLEEKEAYYSGK